MAAVKVVADVAARAVGAVVLVRYVDVSKYDGQRGWFLPDDYVVHGEHPRDAAARILREQVGIEPPELRLADVESFADGAWHLIFHYAGELTEAPSLSHGANVAAAQWFPLDALPPPGEVAHEGWALEVIERVLPK